MSSKKVSEGTFFQANLSHCLDSSSVLGARSLYVVSSMIIQMVSRGFTSREFAGRQPFARKIPNPSGTMAMSAYTPPFSLQGFPASVGHISSYCCARKFKIVKLNFFTFLCCRIITDILTALWITFLTHLNEKTAIHSLVYF